MAAISSARPQISLSSKRNASHSTAKTDEAMVVVVIMNRDIEAAFFRMTVPEKDVRSFLTESNRAAYMQMKEERSTLLSEYGVANRPNKPMPPTDLHPRLRAP